MATNETEFTALPGGDRFYNGPYDLVGYYGYWWSATENSATNAWYRSLGYDGTSTYRTSSNKDCGRSVRCVRD